MQSISLLGSTGSIGTSTLDVVRRHPERYRLHSLAAGSNAKSMAAQIREFRPEVAVMATVGAVDEVAVLLRDAGLAKSQWPELLSGPAALARIATEPTVDFVVSAIVGVAGLEATYGAVCRGKRIGLANKETLVAGGSLVMAAARRHGSTVIPIDSEHNGAHQCLRAGERQDAVKLILTASGGPFRETPLEQLAFVTPDQALNHPTWKMGPRITIDSATLMNKGFEVIEACWLFDFEPSQVEVVIHPQSSVHALVEFRDGSVLAQVCATDMRMPIQYALTWPARDEAPVPKLNWQEARHWDFWPPDFQKFPLLRLAYKAQEEKNSSTCTLNAADEIAVDAFLHEQIPFTGIAEVVSDTLSKVPARTLRTVEDVLEIDRESRRVAREVVHQRAVVRV